MTGKSSEGRLILIRRLVALDITLHGPRFILLEFGLGTPAIILFGLWLIVTGVVPILGLYISLTGINYVPLLFYAIVLVRKGSAKTEVEYGLAHDEHYVRKYSLQQLIIFIPLAVPLIAIVQEARASIPTSGIQFHQQQT